MCCCCGEGWGRTWTGLTVLWALIYVCAGAVQIVTGIFLVISLPDGKVCSNIWAGTWNVVAGIGGGMIACFGAPSPCRQRRLLYVALSILAVNTINAVITEWVFYMAGDALIIPAGFLSTEPLDPDETEVVLSGTDKHVKSLVANARVTAGIAAAIVLIASFLDSQFTFCSIDNTRHSHRSKTGKARGSHEQVSDIEYIIPRPKSNSEPKPTNTVYNAYAQSWVFETEATNSNHAVSPYLKLDADAEALLVNGKEHVSPLSSVAPSDVTMPISKEETIIIANPVVHIEEASDESNSNSDRKLCYMKSFSRTPSPVVLSAASSQASLNNPPIYECLEKLTEPTVYRSRLNTALSVKEEPQYSATSPRKSELPSPRGADTMQYASLMVELEQALSKKEKNATVMSPHSDQESSKSESQKTDFKSSDADFSKELEAALQLIQDLESPNTAETPSEGPRPLAVWHSGQHSDSEKTLSAVGSLAELTSPLTECLPLPVPHHQHGKRDCGVVVQCQQSQSQSTSGYSSPTRKLTPNWSTSSSMDGSSSDLGRTLSFQIRNTNNSAVISLFPGPPCEQKCSTHVNNFSTLPAKSVTVVRINGNDLDVQNNNIPDKIDNRLSTTLYEKYLPKNNVVKRSASMSTWNVMSLLRKKKQIPRFPPDLESAIIKSESLAHLTEKELLARHERNKEVQRQIEQRVQQQMGQISGQMTESNC